MDENQTLSVKRIIANVQVLFAFLLSKWLPIAIAGILGGIAGICYAYYSKPKYTGNLDFVLSDGNSQGSINSLASQFGFDIGSGGNDVFSQDNVMILMTSRKMLSRALFRNLPGKKETLIDLYIQTQKMDKQWKSDEYLSAAYPFPKSYTNLSPLQDSLFREIYTNLTGGVITVQQPDKKVNVFQVATTYYNEKFACFLTKYLVEEASSFYIETKTSIARQNLSMLTREADSLRSRLGVNITSTASAADQILNLNQNYQVGRVPVQKSQVDAAVTQAAYTEVVKNLEVAKITLAKAFPIYQIIDEPSLPLKQKKLGRALGGIIFGFLAGVIVVAFLTIRFYLKTTL